MENKYVKEKKFRSSQGAFKGGLDLNMPKWSPIPFLPLMRQLTLDGLLIVFILILLFFKRGDNAWHTVMFSNIS